MHTWTLTDTARDLHLDEFTITAAELGQAGSFGIRKRTLHGGLREGVDVVELDNGLLRATIVPTRGMGLWRVAAGELFLGWQSPVAGPVHPHWVPVWEPSGIGWLSGFDELLVRCGLTSNGAPQFDDQGRLQYPLHGQIANLPAWHVEASYDAATHTLSVTGVVDEARLFGHKLRLRTTYSARLKQPHLNIVDEVTNLSAEPSDMQLLYHINFGAPLATPGARARLPVETLAPRDAHSASDVDTWHTYAPPQAGWGEFAHFAELLTDRDGRTRAMLVAADGARGASVVFSRRQLPCFTLWKSQRLPADGYVTGLEPGTNYPNTRAFEQSQGRVVKLEPGQTRRFELELCAHLSEESVCRASHEVERLSSGVEPTIHRKPMPGWSA